MKTAKQVELQARIDKLEAHQATLNARTVAPAPPRATESTDAMFYVWMARMQVGPNPPLYFTGIGIFYMGIFYLMVTSWMLKGVRILAIVFTGWMEIAILVWFPAPDSWFYAAITFLSLMLLFTLVGGTSDIVHGMVGNFKRVGRILRKYGDD